MQGCGGPPPKRRQSTPPPYAPQKEPATAHRRPRARQQRTSSKRTRPQLATTPQQRRQQHADPTQQQRRATEVPPLDETCPAESKCGRADKPYHEGQGDQRRGNKHTKSAIRAEFQRRGIDKPDHLSWNEAAHMVGMTPFSEEQQHDGGTPPQPRQQGGSRSKSPTRKGQSQVREAAQPPPPPNLRQPPPEATPHRTASSSGEPAPGSKEDTEAKQKHHDRMANAQARAEAAQPEGRQPGEERAAAQTREAPAAASHHHSTQPQQASASATEEATSSRTLPQSTFLRKDRRPYPSHLTPPVTWSTPANYYLTSMGGYLPPNPLPLAFGAWGVGLLCARERRWPHQATSELGGRFFLWGLKAKCTLLAWELRTPVNARQTRQPSAQATTGCSGTIPRSRATSLCSTRTTGTCCTERAVNFKATRPTCRHTCKSTSCSKCP